MSRPPAAALTSSKSNPFSTPADSLLTASSSPSTSRTPSPVGTTTTTSSNPARAGPRQRAYSLREGRGGGQVVGAGVGTGAAGMREKQGQGKQETSLMMPSTGLSEQARKDARKLDNKQKIKRNVFMVISAIGVGGIITATILGIKGML